MIRFPRTAISVGALFLLASACASQSVPEREPFEVPTEIVPDFVIESDPNDLFSSSGECEVAVGEGARVLRVVEGSGSDTVLRPGDILTAIDGSRIGTREQLLSTMQGRAVGDVVAVSGLRAGEPFTVDVPLSSAPEDLAGPILGVAAESRLTVTAPGDMPAEPLSDALRRPAIVDGQIFLFEPIGGSWAHYPGVPATRMAALGSDLFSVATEDNPLSLVRVGDGALLPISVEPFMAHADPDTLVELQPALFTAVLTSVGDLLLVGGVAVSSDGEAISTVFAVDPLLGELAWSQPLGVAPSGNALLALDGFRNPAGDLALVGLSERDQATGALSNVFTYLLLSSDGSTAVPVGLDRLQSTARVTGWFDDGSLLYVIPNQLPEVMRWSIHSGEHASVFVVSEADASVLVTVTPVGDSHHVLRILENSVTLVDVDALTLVRHISAGCNHGYAGGLSG